MQSLNTGVVSFIALHLPLHKVENNFIHEVGIVCQNGLFLIATYTSFRGKKNKNKFV